MTEVLPVPCLKTLESLSNEEIMTSFDYVGMKKVVVLAVLCFLVTVTSSVTAQRRILNLVAWLSLDFVVR